MQYTLSLTTRMMTIAGLCLLFLCVLLFLLGMEIGKKISAPAERAVPAVATTAAPPASVPAAASEAPPVPATATAKP